MKLIPHYFECVSANQQDL